MPTLSYEQEQTELERAILRKLPKEVERLACNLADFIQQDNITPQNIIHKAQQNIIQSNHDIQPLIQAFNQQHPTHPYNSETFGKPIQAPVKQALTTQFKHSIETATQAREKSPTNSPEESAPSPSKIKPK